MSNISPEKLRYCASTHRRFDLEKLLGYLLRLASIAMLAISLSATTVEAEKAFRMGCMPYGADQSGSSACAVAHAQSVCVYGNVKQGPCYARPDGAFIDNQNAQGNAGRGGYSSAFCTDPAESMVDFDCIILPDPDPKWKNYCLIGNPIDPVTGAKIEEYTDLSIGQGGVLLLKRFYTSKLRAVHSYFRQSRFGIGWRSNFDAALYLASSDRVHIVLPNWQYLVFVKGSDSAWRPAYLSERSWIIDTTGSPKTFASVGDNYELTLEDGSVYVFDNSGRFIQIRELNGYVQNIVYDNIGRNSMVIDGFGRTLNFSYNLSGQAINVMSSTGITIDYEYIDKLDPAFRQNALAGQPYDPSNGAFEAVLSTVKFAGPPATAIAYRYDDAANRFALTSIVDERNVIYAEFSYNSDGYAIQTKHAGDVNKYDLSYSIQDRQNTVTSPLNKQSIYSFAMTGQGRPQMNGLQGLASANCPASGASFTFDGNGYVASTTDEEGRKTTYVRDAQGRPTSITRGAP